MLVHTLDQLNTESRLRILLTGALYLSTLNNLNNNPIHMAVK